MMRVRASQWKYSSVMKLICDPLSENLALPTNIEFESETISSVQVVFQLNSDYCTKVVYREFGLYHTEL